ncbi:hypothetical protein B0H10DRAFT_1943162 [Mycena sp. CBHHK59/15]|nr:hypothetical protein B0H10DRAFT_1943162 [Mycena sp. CBHHK59/15]
MSVKLTIFWLAGAFVTDILITVQTAKASSHVSRTESMINRLILNTIQTGAATVLVAGADLAMFVKFTDTNYYFAFGYVLGKLYTNSFMVTLNLRAPRLHSEQTESIGMGIQLSHHIERTNEGLRKPSENNKLSNW